ncbi:MAG: protein kinase domain-containing protein [Planctomycetota bacterium]|jgi:Tol biopolymer transport system component
MPIATGQTLTHYEILGPLGSGAMGEVYRARDTRLQREVAIKVLPDEFSADAQRVQRFEREARTLAGLSHANLAHVYGIDQVGDTCFIAMELVPGEDLAARLARGPLPLHDTLDVCHQIAEGLEAAHEAGVVHRDLKPANVCLTPDGKVKLLDFGLAKALTAGAGSGAGTAGSDAASETGTALVTEPGRVVGTPTYMAPEQARGKPTDKRADIWAFGCVLYECLAGRRPFGGETLSDVMAGILEREPDWSALPAATPPGMRDLIARCLRKDPRRRLRDIGDARIALEEAVLGGARPPEVRAVMSPLVPVLGLVALVAVALAIVGWSRSGTERPRPVVTSRMKPITVGPEWEGSPNWSPNAESLVYERMVGGDTDLYVKSIVGTTATLLAGGPGDQTAPRWSPDGKHVAYLSSGSAGAPVFLARVEGQGEPRRLVDTDIPRLYINVLARSLGDRPWLDERTLFVSRSLPTGQTAIFRVDIETSESRQITSPPVGSDDLGASISFDGSQVVFERRPGGRGELWTMAPDGSDAKVLLADAYDNKSPSWRPDGRHVLFRGFHGGTFENVWEIDVQTGALRSVTDLTKDVWEFSVSFDDRIAIQPFWHDTFLWTLDVESREKVERVAHNGENFGARYSPDDRFIAYHSNRFGDSEIWRIDLASGAEVNLSEHEGEDFYPDWSPDGLRLVFLSDRAGSLNLWRMNADGGEKRRLTTDPIGVYGTILVNSSLVARWSPDGSRIAYIKAGENGNSVWTIDPDGEDDRLLIERVYCFDWLDDRRVVFSRQEEPGQDEVLYVMDLESGEKRALFEGPHMEIDVAPDGSAIAFPSGPGHLGMKPHVLRLLPAEEPGGLPRAAGPPESLYSHELPWHIHMGGWSADSKSLVFTYDRDYNDIYVLEETH